MATHAGETRSQTPGNPRSATAEADLPVEFCPRCAYIVHGLPAEHRCPECGLSIDRRWHVFCGRPPTRHGRRIWKRILILVLGGLICLAISFVLFPVRLNLTLHELQFLTTVLAVVAASTLFDCLIPRTYSLVGVGPRGIFVHFNRRHIESVPWSQLGQARYELAYLQIAVEREGEDLKFDFDRFFAKPADEIDRFVQIVNAYTQSGQPPIHDDAAATIEEGPERLHGS